MIFVSLLALAIGTALIKLGIASVMVTILSKLLTASVALIALLLAVLLWQTWRHRR